MATRALYVIVIPAGRQKESDTGVGSVFIHSGFAEQVAAVKVIAEEILLIRSVYFTGYTADN